ncbi:MAG: pyrimidine-nucleoside phosphorylase [Clostridia bacterium]|nr:pyrimidine-nucleoside phosphorylase [Clostridia bacterium]
MRMVDLIRKKRNGEVLTNDEIDFIVQGCTDGSIPDYQLSALMMAICFQGMTKEETARLTLSMANSGDTVDLSSIGGITVDKHSTGGVGDKTSLVIVPVAAACGVKIAKMSGRGLGHTGGTVDKMESIPGMQTALGKDEFFGVVNRVGCAVIGQSGNLCPADKKLYALRDVTATVESIPLIASSIMSKKIAAGSDRILLDVKTGSGAFMKTQAEAEALAREMVEIGTNVGRKTVALITDMDRPLGRAIGNALEIIEVCETLNGRGPADLTAECTELAANMIYLGEKAGDMETARQMAKTAMTDGTAFQKLCEMVTAQGGDASYLINTDNFELGKVRKTVLSPESGFITRAHAEQIGRASVLLGAGRETKDSAIDFGAGIVLCKNCGDYAEAGEPLAVLYAADEERCAQAEKALLEAFSFGEEKPAGYPLVLARIE